ncbi:MAG: hypothetical protein ACFFEL_14235, partial [Candidatus Thorarchaeota archaeon]
MKVRRLHVVLFLIVIGVLGVSLFIPTNTMIHPPSNMHQKTDSFSLMTEDSISYAECDCENPDTDSCDSSGSFYVITDKMTYLPSEIVTISGWEFTPLTTVNLTIYRPCGCGEHDFHSD